MRLACAVSPFEKGERKRTVGSAADSFKENRRKVVGTGTGVQGPRRFLPHARVWFTNRRWARFMKILRSGYGVMKSIGSVCITGLVSYCTDVILSRRYVTTFTRWHSFVLCSFRQIFRRV